MGLIFSAIDTNSAILRIRYFQESENGRKYFAQITGFSLFGGSVSDRFYCICIYQIKKFQNVKIYSKIPSNIFCGFLSIERMPDLTIYSYKVRKSNFSDHKTEITSDNKITAKYLPGNNQIHSILVVFVKSIEFNFVFKIECTIVTFTNCDYLAVIPTT